MDILFLCAGNSCRSAIAEALFKNPAGYVQPRAPAVFKNTGLPTEGLSRKSWDNLPEKPDAATLQATLDDTVSL